MRPFEILGLGTALPEHSISQFGAAAFAATCVHPDATGGRNVSEVIQTLYRRAGLERRHSVLLESSADGEATAERFYRFADSAADRGPATSARMQRYELQAPRLAVKAAAAALQQSGLNSQQITHLITVSCSGFSAPGADVAIIDGLALPTTVARTHVGFMGCHGALNGLRAAHAFASADPSAVVLLCAVELCTLHHQYGWDPQKIVANSLFADGAAAVIGRAAVEGGGADGATASPGSSPLPGHLVGNASCIIPGTTGMMTWNIRDAGFEMTLSPEVPGVITRHLPTVLAEFLSQHDLTTDQVISWCIHPGGPRILTAAAEAAQLTDSQLEPSLTILRQCGNMSSPTVLFILQEQLRRGSAGPCVMLGFGPGLNVEMALLR